MPNIETLQHERRFVLRSVINLHEISRNKLREADEHSPRSDAHLLLKSDADESRATALLLRPEADKIEVALAKLHQKAPRDADLGRSVTTKRRRKLRMGW